MNKQLENKETETKPELYTLLGVVNFYRVSRPYCRPSHAFTFATNEENAVKKVAGKYGYVTDSKAHEIANDEFNEFVS
tara:strand:+ start:4558 stop:4791 length:234 start_codon:yes stop_codon:yes gene_type:complete